VEILFVCIYTTLLNCAEAANLLQMVFEASTSAVLWDEEVWVKLWTLLL